MLIWVTFHAGPMIQPSTVLISGTNVDRVIEFVPDGSRTVLVNFPINNDNTGLETTEVYLLALTLISQEEVIVGQPQIGLYSSTIIRIDDDDGESNRNDNKPL